MNKSDIPNKCLLTESMGELAHAPLPSNDVLFSGAGFPTRWELAASWVPWSRTGHRRHLPCTLCPRRSYGATGREGLGAEGCVIDLLITGDTARSQDQATIQVNTCGCIHISEQSINYLNTLGITSSDY